MNKPVLIVGVFLLIATTEIASTYGSIQLQRECSVKDESYGVTLSGFIFEEGTNKPLPDMYVGASRVKHISSPPYNHINVEVLVQTDENGRFLFEIPESTPDLDRVIVFVSSPYFSHQNKIYKDAEFIKKIPLVDDLSSQGIIEINLTSDVEINFTLSPTPERAIAVWKILNIAPIYNKAKDLEIDVSEEEYYIGEALYELFEGGDYEKALDLASKGEALLKKKEQTITEEWFREMKSDIVPGPYIEEPYQGDGFTREDNIVLTYYFYWYDVYSCMHVKYFCSVDSLQDHPLSLENFSYKSVEWHKKELNLLQRMEFHRFRKTR
jgi:hypothetical protein